MLYYVFHDFTKTRKLSYGRYTHSGIRVRPETRKNDKFGKRALSLKNSSADSKAVFSEKFLFGIWRLMLSRYDIILNIYDLILNI